MLGCLMESAKIGWIEEVSGQEPTAAWESFRPLGGSGRLVFHSFSSRDKCVFGTAGKKREGNNFQAVKRNKKRKEKLAVN